MSCHVCGAAEEIKNHVLFQCPFAQTVWENSDFPSILWPDPCSSVWEQFFHACDLLDMTKFGEPLLLLHGKYGMLGIDVFFERLMLTSWTGKEGSAYST